MLIYEDFSDYHTNLYKTGNGFDLPVYRGARSYQQGGGLGKILQSIGRVLFPIFKKILPSVTRGTVRTAKQLLKSKTGVKTILKTNLKKTGVDILKALASSTSSPRPQTAPSTRRVRKKTQRRNKLKLVTGVKPKWH